LWPTTITAAHAWLEREFAAVLGGCEACALCEISEAIDTCGGGAAVAALAVIAITPAASAAADATATPRLNRHLENGLFMEVPFCRESSKRIS
jgi:hypothetical protein